MDNRDKRIERAQTSVVFNAPFFAPGVARLPVVWDDTIETACTDGEQIRFNPAFANKLTDGQLVTVLCHEVGHCLLGHIWRTPVGSDMGVWNEAVDYEVNGMLKEWSDKVTAKNLANPFPLPDGALVADQYAGVAAEVVYGELSKRPGMPQNGSGGVQHGGGSSKQQGGGKAAQGNSKNQGIGDIEAPKVKPGQSAAQAQASSKKCQNDWNSTLIQSCAAAKSRGDLPASLERFVSELVSPSLPWWELLRSFLREQCQDDWNWMKPNAYFQSDFIMPSLDSEKCGAVVFATDTSGSINNELLAKFQAEKQSCLDELSPASLVDIYCDAAITKVAEYRPGEKIAQDAPGGGGTDFRSVFTHCDNMAVTPKCLVYLTDLDGQFPDKAPNFPCLWIVYGGETEAPFGEVVKAD